MNGKKVEMKGEFFIKILLELILQPVHWARFFFFVVSSLNLSALGVFSLLS